MQQIGASVPTVQQDGGKNSLGNEKRLTEDTLGKIENPN